MIDVVTIFYSCALDITMKAGFKDECGLREGSESRG